MNQVMSQLNIRKATEADVEVIARFNRKLCRELEARELDEETITAGVKNLLSRPEQGFHLVAEQDGEVVGCSLITGEWSDWSNGVFWWIKSVYVSTSARRQGVNRKLYDFARELAKGMDDVRGIRVYIGEQNRAATVAYKALGMKELSRRMFEERF